MGKRTKQITGKTHQPRARDFWSTIDPRAIPPLLPHLPAGARYAEPMAGSGSLIEMLRPHVPCAWASDLAPQTAEISQGDVLEAEIGDADVWITNPAWTRKLLHRVIIHLSDQAPTFLLFDSDWLSTNQAGKFMERCRKVIFIGRLIWIPGTTNAGFTSCAWYEFGRPIAGSAPVFYGHDCLPPEAQTKMRRACHDCGVLIDRFGKWRLQPRNGTLTPVHLHCDNPSSYYARGAQPSAPVPLFDYVADDMPLLPRGSE